MAKDGFVLGPESCRSDSRGKALEVIVGSFEEAVEAELGGADCLEVVRSLERGGLTPELGIVRRVRRESSLPVRVMLRENSSMSVRDGGELTRMQSLAAELSSYSIEGLVLGFTRDGAVDTLALGAIASAAPGCRITFHRAFETVKDPEKAICELRKFAQVDRILFRVGDTAWQQQRSEMVRLQALAAPQIQFVLGVGLDESLLSAVSEDPIPWIVHVGRAVREPETSFGRVKREKVRTLKSRLR
jgi:copper homeostasis protein